MRGGGHQPGQPGHRGRGRSLQGPWPTLVTFLWRGPQDAVPAWNRGVGNRSIGVRTRTGERWASTTRILRSLRGRSLLGVTSVLLLLLLDAGTAPTNPVRRIGFIGFYSPGLQSPIIAYFRDGLSELGHVEGTTVSVLYRWADGKLANYPTIAEELVREKVDVIVTPCGPIVAAIRARDATLPLVIRSLDIETCEGEIETLERPGGYTTGTIYFSPAATGRRLELLNELVPRLSHLGILYRRTSDWSAHLADVEAAVKRLGVRAYRVAWMQPSELPLAFGTARGLGIDALLTLGDGVTFFHRQRIFDLAAESKLPVLYDFPMFPAGEELGLISYAVDVRTFFRHVAAQVDQILRGTKPGHIPVARPQRFRLIINRDAARSLGLSSPLLARPDPMVEDRQEVSTTDGEVAR